MVLVCKKVYNTNMLGEQCVPLHMFFRTRPGCGLIGACALIRINMVVITKLGAVLYGSGLEVIKLFFQAQLS